MKKEVEIYRKRSRQGGLFISFLLLLLFYPSHAITWEDRGGEAIRLGAVTATTAAKLSNNPNFEQITEIYSNIIYTDEYRIDHRNFF